ncbi:hypothetical protein D3C71_1606340 [compost metagenome]
MQCGRDIAPPPRHHLHCVPFLLQGCGSFGARRRKIGEIPAIHQRPDFGEHGGQILVGHGSEHRVGGGKEAHRVQICSQRRHRMWVVRDIQHQGGLPRDDLKTTGQLDHGHAVAHCLGGHGKAVAQCLQRCQHPRRVDQLVGTTQ